MTVVHSLRRGASKDPIDRSLRMWSQSVELEPLVRSLGMHADILHVRGTPIPTNGRLIQRIAGRHYASFAARRDKAGGNIEAWMGPLVASIGAHENAARLIASGEIEACFWIAVLGQRRLPDPEIPNQLVDEIAALTASIFIENYTQLVAGNPRKTWLPAQPASQKA